MIEKGKHAIRTQKYSEALGLFLEIHKIQPGDLEILEGIAKSYFGLRKFDNALDICNQALSIDANIAWPHIVRSYILFIQKRMALCKEEANIAIEIAPSDWEPIFWWGTILCFENKIDEGISFLEKAVSMETNEWSLYNNLATYYFKKRSYKKYYWALAEMNRLRSSLFVSFLITYGKIFGFDKRT